MVYKQYILDGEHLSKPMDAVYIEKEKERGAELPVTTVVRDTVIDQEQQDKRRAAKLLNVALHRSLRLRDS